MGTRNTLASLTGTGESEDAAKDVDWARIRRVQHGLSRPSGSSAGSRHNSQTLEEFRGAEARSRRALRLAHGLAFLAGVLLGLAFLRGFADDFRLLCGVSMITCAAALVAGRAYKWRVDGALGD